MFDLVQESGFAREYITDECLAPCQSMRRWMTCNVVKEEKTMFRMYLDDAQGRFLLSAKRIGDTFYISQYEAFPEVRGVKLTSSRMDVARFGLVCARARSRLCTPDLVYVDCLLQSVEEVPDCYYCAVLR
jgi:hypothetical protein